MHLVHFYSHPGGIEVLLPGSINEMTGYDFDAFVIRPPLPGGFNIYSSTEIVVTYGSRSNIRALIRLFKYAKHNHYHIFNVYNIGPLFLLILRLAGVKKLIYSIHGTKYWKVRWKGFFLRILWKLALKKEYIIVSNSEFSKATFLKKVNSEVSVQVLYNPIDSRKFSPAEQRNPYEIRKIVYAGRLSYGKNLYRWIDLAVQIHDVFKETRFEIYGVGPLYNSLEHHIISLSAGGYVFLKGFRSDVENIYRNADLLLFLSEYESFGNVVVESILCGTPVIVSDLPSMNEIFRDFPGFIVKTDGNLADNVIKKLQKKDELKELALRAHDQFADRFSVEAHMTHLDKIYKSFDA